MSTFVAVVDYGMANLDSVRRALELQGATAVVTSDPADVADADRIVLPGVGAFGIAMDNLRERGLDRVLTEQVIDQGAPFLGICLGMQLMAATSDEHGAHEGLGWIDASVVRLTPTADDPRVPHVGWNEVHPVVDHPLFHEVETDRDFYFVHSFHVACGSDDAVLATTPYTGGFTSAVVRGNALGVQFHPEKSQAVGQTLLRNFLAWKG